MGDRQTDKRVTHRVRPNYARVKPSRPNRFACSVTVQKQFYIFGDSHYFCYEFANLTILPWNWLEH